MKTILCDIGDEQKIIEEEKKNWIINVLIALGADEEVIIKNDMSAKEHLMLLGLDVVNNLVDGTVKIYRPEYTTFEFCSKKDLEIEKVDVESNEKLIAEWKVPEIVRFKTKNSQYCRIIIREWALPFQMEEK